MLQQTAEFLLVIVRYVFNALVWEASLRCTYTPWIMRLGRDLFEFIDVDRDLPKYTFREDFKMVFTGPYCLSPVVIGCGSLSSSTLDDLVSDLESLHSSLEGLELSFACSN